MFEHYRESEDYFQGRKGKIKKGTHYYKVLSGAMVLI